MRLHIIVEAGLLPLRLYVRANSVRFRHNIELLGGSLRHGIVVARRIVQFELAQKLVFEIEDRMLGLRGHDFGRRLVKAFHGPDIREGGLPLLSVRGNRLRFKTDDAGEFCQRVIVREDIRTIPATRKLFLCHYAPLTLTTDSCQRNVGKR